MDESMAQKIRAISEASDNGNNLEGWQYKLVALAVEGKLPPLGKAILDKLYRLILAGKPFKYSFEVFVKMEG